MGDIHLINHTHWDREWFLTHEYTTSWIPALVDSLEELAEANPGYQFLMDGQTLIVEDLLKLRPDYESRVQELVKVGNLEIGPVYSQPDWRIIGGELHVRNLTYGVGDTEALGGTADVAWLVDTFGHLSQTPQLLALAGVEAAYVWRGVPRMLPIFSWIGSDGTSLPTIDLFGGYRNLYGVTKTSEIAVKRLEAEVNKLRPEYGDLPIPLFDGYDLDTEPEDPARYYESLDVPPDIELVASSRRAYVDAILTQVTDLPEIRGELLSGKFGATFPGSLSSRAYLKILQHDGERALFRYVEPLAVLAALRGATYDNDAFESRGREMLRYGVHDSICGVSIDQVHERMERSAREILDWAGGQIEQSVEHVLADFAPAWYAVSVSPLVSQAVVRAGGFAHRLDTAGIGINPVSESSEVRPVDRVVERFEHSTDHYQLRVDGDGIVVADVGTAARLIVRNDDGDTYSSEPGDVLGELVADGDPVVVDESEFDTTVRQRLAFSLDDRGITIEADLTVRVDQGATINFELALDSSGTGFRVDAEFDTGLAVPSVLASMPFDVVERTHDDDDLFGQTIDPALAGILMGQRETGTITEFPFHDFVAMTSDNATRGLVAQGIRSYRSQPDGRIAIALRRSSEWLALTDLRLRAGDAGPAMYVPGARSERRVTHRFGFVLASQSSHDGICQEFIQASEEFHARPVIARVEGGDGTETEWSVFKAPLPTTSFHQADDRTIARFYNPLEEETPLGETLTRRSIRGVDLGPASSVRPKEIVTVELSPAIRALGSASGAEIAVYHDVADRAGRSRSKPDDVEMALLDDRIDALQAELELVHDRLRTLAESPERYRTVHQSYVVERELLELSLSRELNNRLATSTDEVSIPNEVDDVIAELGWSLNDLRVKRRIYDYVVQALEPTASVDE